MYHPNKLTPPQMDLSFFDLDMDLQKFSCVDESFLEANDVTCTPAPLNHSTAATPPRTPALSSGPRLIPRVRMQDQVTELDVVPARQRSDSNRSSNGFPVNLNPHQRHSSMFRRSASPAMPAYLMTPNSTTSPCSPIQAARLGSPMSFNPAMVRPGIQHGRSTSTSAVPSHSRNLSACSIDGAVRTRYGYPTYRSTPRGTSSNRPQTATAWSHLMPSSMLSTPMRSSACPPKSQAVTPSHGTPDHSINLTTPSTISTLEPFTLFDFSVDPSPDLSVGSTSSLLAYLTKPNPSPSLVQRLVEPPRGQNINFWYDVRNLRRWTSFDTATMSSTPGLLDLIRCPIADTKLPAAPQKKGTGFGNEMPETQEQLHEVLRDFFAVKLNAALHVALGENHLAIRSLHHTGPTSSARRTQPEFISNYADDTEKTFLGDGSQRGRVVGVVKCYEQWNSGMRTSSPATQVKYLAGLSSLHRFMREHGCRYGFIITEIELICVRYGGDHGAHIPLFGFFELSEPIRLSMHYQPNLFSSPFTNTFGDQDAMTSGQDPHGLKMTAALALFYLHMLAKKEPLPGQYSWRLEIGGPSGMTRKKHLDRDAWMPKPNLTEKREAKRNRGWVWPDEPLTTKERGGRRKGRQ